MNRVKNWLYNIQREEKEFVTMDSFYEFIREKKWYLSPIKKIKKQIIKYIITEKGYTVIEDRIQYYLTKIECDYKMPKITGCERMLRLFNCIYYPPNYYYSYLPPTQSFDITLKLRKKFGYSSRINSASSRVSLLKPKTSSNLTFVSKGNSKHYNQSEEYSMNQSDIKTDDIHILPLKSKIYPSEHFSITNIYKKSDNSENEKNDINN